MTPDGQVGIAMHACPGRPELSLGGEHRYVHPLDGEAARAWHITQLRPSRIAERDRLREAYRQLQLK